ncbi:MAG TPA: DUF4388 domain-containing protein [Acidimicrobiia bacterium]|nr:DUF4388 domain-containing protein [Acidimicrobiia bacterium]
MSLSGNLGFVPIDEVLRLLTRSKQQGSVNVTGNGLHGRIFVGKGGIDLATVSDNDELHRHLVNSGYADEKALNRVTTGETTLAAIAESNNAIVDLIREMTVESLYQIGFRGTEFQVHDGATTPYASPKTFELEALLQDADERKREWHKVSEMVPDLTGAIAFRRDLGDREEVTVKVDDWKVLSEIGAGSSVEEIADKLGTTDFWTARVAARLVNNELIVLRGPESAAVDDVAEEYEPTPQADYVEAEDAPEVRAEPEPETYIAPSDEYAAYEAEKSAGVAETIEPEAANPDAETEEEVNPDRSWWQEPTDEGGPATEDGSQAPAVVAEGLSEIPSVGEPVEGSEVEEDTEAFLEKVFSELDPEPEVEEGHGLLRRRRMGTLRDFSSDS